jgi:hypothetical protein
MSGIGNEVLFAGMLILGLLALGSCRQETQGGSAGGSSKSAPAAKGSAEDGGAGASEPKPGSGTAAGGGTSKGEQLSGENSFGELSAAKVEVGDGVLDIVPLAEGATASATWTIEAATEPNAAPLSSLKLLINESGGKLSIKEEYTGKANQRRPRVHLSLQLPAQAKLEASLGNGEMRIDNSGKLVANLGNGEMTLRGNCQSCDASLGNGDLQANLLLSQGKHSLNVGNGSLLLNLLPGSAVDYDACTGMGDIKLNGVPGKVKHSFVSQQASGSFNDGGGGAAKASLNVGMGEVRVEAGTKQSRALPEASLGTVLL